MIEQEIFNRYNKNLEFIKRIDINLYNKLILFDEAISKGLYRENFFLEYKEDYFDIFIEGVNSFLYGKNSFEYSKDIVNNTKLDRSSAFILSKYKKIDDFNFNKFEYEVLVTRNDHLALLYNYAYKYDDIEKNIYEIKKFIFIGIGLGLHIPLIIDKFNLKSIFIVEPNIEFFRLSLFVIDYYKLSCEIFFSVADDDIEMKINFNRFYNSFKLYNYIIKYQLFLGTYEKYLDNISYLLASFDSTAFNYYSRFIASYRLLKRIKEKYKFLNYTNILSKYKVALIAAGPSLEKDIEFLQKNQDKFIIVSVGAVVRTLLKYGIKPDIITSIDAGEVVLKQFKDLDVKDYIFYSSSMTSDNVFELFNKEKIFLFPIMYNFGINLESPKGVSVGEATFFLLLKLKAKEIYLFGLDASFNKQGFSHVKDHYDSAKEEINKNDKSKFNLNSKIKVKGNKREFVYTKFEWKTIIEFMGIFATKYNKSSKVYNLSDGAKFEGIEAIDAKDIKLNKINKKGLIDKFKKNSFYVDIKYINQIKDEQKYFKDIYSLINNYKIKSFDNYENFKNNLLIFEKDFFDILDKFNSPFAKDILNNFIDTANKIMLEFFNRNEILRKKEHFNNMYSNFIIPLEKLVFEVEKIYKIFD